MPIAITLVESTPESGRRTRERIHNFSLYKNLEYVSTIHVNCKISYMNKWHKTNKDKQNNFETYHAYYFAS